MLFSYLVILWKFLINLCWLDRMFVIIFYYFIKFSLCVIWLFIGLILKLVYSFTYYWFLFLIFLVLCVIFMVF